MRDPVSRLTIMTVACVQLAACGARSGQAGDASSGCLPAAVRGVVVTTSTDRCTFEGASADGQRHVMRCERDPPRCVWFTDGSERCRCAEPNWAMVCPNSVPLCVGWNLPFDFVHDVTYE